MGKYMEKAKIAADVAVMELPQSLLGVRTRAKTLALRRLQSSQPSPDSESCYLQLRSRRLEKHPTLLEERRKPSGGTAKRNCQKGTDSATCRKLNLESSSRFRVSSVHSSSVGSASISNHDAGEGCFEILSKGCEDLGVDASFGENNLDPEARDRQDPVLLFSSV
ncbi:unnamed protein product [Cuscuta campestris]|uniref:Uncharacterized protein n=1 Tax=Cuscuta campestris TaxID=132261 RepID=A0A484N4A3_9ASTE|nr:unnamed protein product [Cuscuta campestris]